jgi:hypothetical protein
VAYGAAPMGNVDVMWGSGSAQKAQFQKYKSHPGGRVASVVSAVMTVLVGINCIAFTIHAPSGASNTIFDYFLQLCKSTPKSHNLHISVVLITREIG